MTLAAAHHHLILDTTWTGFAALLIVVGAVMVLGDAAATIGMTWGGTRPQPAPAWRSPSAGLERSQRPWAP